MAKWLLISALSLSLFAACSKEGEKEQEVHPVMKLIPLTTEGKDYKNIIRNGDTSYVLRSGLVELQPGKDVGEHSSGQYEELIIPLIGKGEMISQGDENVPVTPENAVYCPPGMTHNVKNTGDTLLKYIYIVAKTSKKI